MPRCYGHDYRSRCIYHITLSKTRGTEPFGTLCGTVEKAGIRRSRLGAIIEKQIRNLPALHPSLKPLQYCIMPDHLHLLLFVTIPTEQLLGNYIGMMKVAIHQEYRALTGIDTPVFDEGFYDCILSSKRSLDTLFRYLRENPHRLAVRRAHPEFFRRANSLHVGNETFQAYGNIQLLENPFREQVVVHRADSPEVRKSHRDQWLYVATNGGVLVSPFISPAEKEIRVEAQKEGGRIILITNEPMGDRYKPSGSDFELCEQGRLLIVSADCPGTLSRRTCVTMNTLAQTIATGTF